MKSIVLIYLLLTTFVTGVYASVLTFSKAYELALENDHELKSSTYQLRSSKEKVTQTKANLYPQVNFSAYYSKAEYKYNPEYGGDTVRQGLYNYGVSLQQTVYNPVLFANIKVQKAQYQLTKTKLSLQEITLADKTFKAYLDLLDSYNKIELLKAYQQLQKSKLKEALKKYEMHLVSKVDMLEAQVEYNAKDIDLQQEKKHYEVAKLKLESIIGSMEFRLPVIEISDVMLQNIEKMKAFIAKREKLLENNLEIQMAKEGISLAAKKIEEASARHYPSVNLSANYMRYGTDTPTIDSSYSYTDRVMLTVDFPIFSGGATSSKVREAEYIKKAALEDLQNAQQKAVVQRDEYLARFERASSSLPMYQKAYESAKVYVDAMDESFKHGLKSIVDVNDANSKLYEVKYKYINNLNELVDAYINLLIVMNDFDGIRYLDAILEQEQ